MERTSPFAAAELALLQRRSDARGLLRLAAHLLAIAVTGFALCSRARAGRFARDPGVFFARVRLHAGHDVRGDARVRAPDGLQDALAERRVGLVRRAAVVLQQHLLPPLPRLASPLHADPGQGSGARRRQADRASSATSIEMSGAAPGGSASSGRTSRWRSAGPRYRFLERQDRPERRPFGALAARRLRARPSRCRSRSGGRTS